LNLGSSITFDVFVPVKVISSDMQKTLNMLNRSTEFIMILLVTSIALMPLGLNHSQIAIAQQEGQRHNPQGIQSNQTSSSLAQQEQQQPTGISFKIDNMTFSHHMTSVNGIQMHYVIGGHGPPVVLLHGWPETWYEWRHVMPALAKNYTVIAPDLRGLGDSSKPPTGYDGKTTAEDIHQLVAQLGFKQIFLVGHDVGSQPAYSYAAAHPTEVKRLVIMEYIFPGFTPPQLEGKVWWFPFHQTPDIPEALVDGKERMYLSWFYHNIAANPAAITPADVDEFVSHYSAPGGMRDGFNYFRAFPEDAVQNENYSKTKLTMPVLAVGAGYIPAFGGDVTINYALYGMQKLAQNVTGIKVPNSGHWIPEERPDFVINMLNNFFGSGGTNLK
jgi:pimeloyl-ACP methyl ester carboxylesterase